MPIMTRITTIALLTLAVAGAAAAASLETHALVTIVPPIEASLAAPVAADGQTAWHVDAVDSGIWQLSMEARHLDGRLIEVRPATAGESPTSDQELATFAGPSDPHRAAPVVMTLVLCRE
jgi:hypothetical protein